MPFEPLMPIFQQSVPGGSQTTANDLGFNGIQYDVTGVTELHLFAPFNGVMKLVEAGDVLPDGTNASSDSLVIKPSPNDLKDFSSGGSTLPPARVVFSDIDKSALESLLIALDSNRSLVTRELYWYNTKYNSISGLSNKIQAHVDDFMDKKIEFLLFKNDKFAKSRVDFGVHNFKILAMKSEGKVWVKDFIDLCVHHNSNLSTHPMVTSISSFSAPTKQAPASAKISIWGSLLDNSNPSEPKFTDKHIYDDVAYLRYTYSLDFNTNEKIDDVNDIVVVEPWEEIRLQIPASLLHPTEDVTVFFGKYGISGQPKTAVDSELVWSVPRNKFNLDNNYTYYFNVNLEGKPLKTDERYVLNAKFKDTNGNTVYMGSSRADLPDLRFCYGLELQNAKYGVQNGTFIPTYNRGMNRTFDKFVSGIDSSQVADLKFTNSDLTHHAALIFHESSSEWSDLTVQDMVDEMTWIRDVLENRVIWNPNKDTVDLGEFAFHSPLITSHPSPQKYENYPGFKDIVVSPNEFQPVDSTNKSLKQSLASSNSQKMGIFVEFSKPRNRFPDVFVNGSSAPGVAVPIPAWVKPHNLISWYHCMKVSGKMSLASPEKRLEFDARQRSTYLWFKHGSSPNANHTVCKKDPDFTLNNFWKDDRMELVEEVDGVEKCNGRYCAEHYVYEDTL